MNESTASKFRRLIYAKFGSVHPAAKELGISPSWAYQLITGEVQPAPWLKVKIEESLGLDRYEWRAHKKDPWEPREAPESKVERAVRVTKKPQQLRDYGDRSTASGGF